MTATLYLIRHAQSRPRGSEPETAWRLSATGRVQADKLARLLAPLGIGHAYSSPYTRSLETVAPFARARSLQVLVRPELGERTLPHGPGHDLRDAWSRSWDDFDYAPAGGEPSIRAQIRICVALTRIVAGIRAPAAVFTHGHVIALFLNSLDATVGRAIAEALRNPDVVKIEFDGQEFHWDRHFALSGLEQIATPHDQTRWED